MQIDANWCKLRVFVYDLRSYEHVTLLWATSLVIISTLPKAENPWIWEIRSSAAHARGQCCIVVAFRACSDSLESQQGLAGNIDMTRATHGFLKWIELPTILDLILVHKDFLARSNQWLKPQKVWPNRSQTRNLLDRRAPRIQGPEGWPTVYPGACPLQNVELLYRSL